ncbi:hypothetical protein F4818DRAFT_117045 [Hypoxylon cercidicola]|nr:hypothetical protein F4818DRAFT_117045 [Hypoxylon cercidicola]
MSTKDSFGSNNPFRRKLPSSSSEGPSPVPTPSLDGSLDSPRPPFKSVQHGDQRWEDTEDKTATVQLKPKKVVKRVRVQSPPPSLPSSPEEEDEDAVPVTRFPPVDHLDFDDDDDGSSSDSQEYREHAGPLSAASSGTHGRDGYEHVQTGPPANPFSTTLQDLEQPGQGQDASALATNAAARGTLDVDSFKRLLLTGYANIPGPSSASAATSGGRNPGVLSHQQPPLPDGASNADMSSVPRQSIFHAMLQETPRTPHEASEPEDPEERRNMLPSSPLSHIASSSTRKKPPPPSSRHGKLIKIELGADIESRDAKSSTPPISINTTSLPTPAPPRRSSSYSNPSQPQPQATDVNKPLPLTPFRPSVEEAVDSPFDREAIGKVPEPFADIQANPRPPTPPAGTRNRSESNGSSQLRKPAAPPPRRHGRSDSRAPSILNTDDDTPPRSSLESNRSRTDSVRANIGISIPAPPPPRRPNHARQGSSYTSPNQGTFASVLPISPGISESELGPAGLGLHRPSSSGQAGSMAGLATITTSKDGLPKLSPPPPPPARQASTRRPPSIRSMDLGNGPSTVRRVSKEKDGGAAPPPPPPRQRGSSRASVEAPIAEDAGSVSSEIRQEPAASAPTSAPGNEILADIDALQRDVNAFMGKYGSTSGS